ncbi:MAG TPA: serine hydrolase domain-containing protein [Opitutaceae bacterium]|nr:serine hydrolase domain-containing protein [Opitutaceae bacterium]
MKSVFSPRSPRLFSPRLNRVAIPLLLVAGSAIFAAEANPKPASVIEAAVRKFMSDPRAVGLSIGVLQEGKTFTFNHGTLVLGKKQVPTEDTVYPIASVTKTFTGSLLALAAVEGKLKLDDDVRQFLKGDFPNLEFQGHPIRLRDLLDHRSGLPFLLPDRDRSSDRETVPYSRENFYADLRRVTLHAPPGDKFQYSNAAAQLAGYILEGLYGLSFEQLVKEKIAQPLGMKDTAITLSAREHTRLAGGHDDAGKFFAPPPDDLQAAGGLMSTVADLLKYARWHLSETDGAVKLSHQPVFTENNYAAALNWQILSADGRRLVWQEGNVPGFTSYLILEPELKIALVILTNESDRTSSARIAAMANEILKGLDERCVLLP